MATTTMRNPAPTAISQDVRVGQNRWAAFHRWAAARQIPQAPRSVFVSPPRAPRARAGGVRRPQDPDPMEEKALNYARGRERRPGPGLAPPGGPVLPIQPAWRALQGGDRDVYYDP